MHLIKDRLFLQPFEPPSFRTFGCSLTGTSTRTVRRIGRSLYTSTYFSPTSDDVNEDDDDEESAATSAPEMSAVSSPSMLWIRIISENAIINLNFEAV